MNKLILILVPLMLVIASCNTNKSKQNTGSQIKSQIKSQNPVPVTLTTQNPQKTSTPAKDPKKTTDNQITIRNIETFAQANPLDVVISIKFAKSIITVKQAIEDILVKSGYTLDNNYASEQVNKFSLPEVHRTIGPIALKRAIKVLLGAAWDLQVDEITRTVQIIQIGGTALQALSPNTKALLKGVISPGALDEVAAISINDELLSEALGKILPNGWRVRLEGEGLSQKTVSAISEDLKRENVIKQILLNVGATGYFYKKLKILVVRNNTKVIK